MSYLSLIRIADGTIVTPRIEAGGVAILPNVGAVSPAAAGWEGGGAITYDYAANEDSLSGFMEIAIEGPAQYKLVPLATFVTPEGKQRVGAAEYSFDGSAVTESYGTEDIPALTPAEKLAAAGLTVEDLKTLLGLA